MRRCFDVGMREELVRTEEEKERYRQLVEVNRQRRRDSFKSDDDQNRHSLSDQVGQEDSRSVFSSRDRSPFSFS